MPTRKSLKTADSKLKLIEENIGVGTWTWDLDTSEVTWSPGLCRILGVDRHSVVPTIDLYQSLVHPDDQIDFDDAVGIVSDKRLEDRSFRIIRPDGVQRWLRSRAQPHMDRNGRTVMLAGFIQDITDDEGLRAAFATQKESSRLLTRLLDGWVWRAYPNGKLMETAHWMKLTGQNPQEAHDWDKLAAIHPDDRQKFRDAWRSAIETRSRYEATIRVRTTAGIYVRKHSRALPLRDVNGEVTQWVGHSVVLAEPEVRSDAPGLLGPAHIRASRALLDWTAPELAEKAGISFSTVRRIEQTASAVKPDRLVKVRETFEAAGIVFSTDAAGHLAISLTSPSTPLERLTRQTESPQFTAGDV